MARAELTLDIPEGVWIGDVTRAHTTLSVRILAALTDADLGVGLAEFTSPDLDAVLADLEEREEITELDVLQRTAEDALVQFETTTPLLLLPIQDSGVPLEMPFTITGGSAEWDLTAPQDRLSALAEQLDAFGISYTVNVLRQEIERERLLTDTQHRLIEEAVEAGYYDTPRQCTLTELADRLEMAKSTCSETLHRAEERIIKAFVAAPEGEFAATITP